MTAQGKLTRDGKSLEVRGTVRLDREWGSGRTGNPISKDGTGSPCSSTMAARLMFYALRKQIRPARCA